MKEVSFIDEERIEASMPNRVNDSDSRLLHLIFKYGIVRNIDHAYYLCVGLSIFFFIVSIFITITSL